MCYAIPGKVKAVEGGYAVVDYFGEEKKAHNEMGNLAVGDYVYAQGGFVIRKISAAEAQEILSSWKELFFSLQETDRRISRLDPEGAGLDREMGRILDRAMEGTAPDEKELLYLLSCQDPKKVEYLLKAANFLRQKYHKNSCCVHGILEISNICERECLYCGISQHNRELERYRMSPQEIIDTATQAVDIYGFKALVLQSGENIDYSIDELAEVIKAIKDKTPVLIFISFGEIGIDGLKKFYDAGARGLLMRFETSNSHLYQRLHPGKKLESRLMHIRKAYEMGYLIVTGALIGLPHQTPQDIVGDIVLAKDLKAEMYSFGPFLPHPETPVKNFRMPHETDILKVLAAIRLHDPQNGRVLVTTAFETLSAEARRKGLLAGASSVMLNITPIAYRKRYNIYPNRAYEGASIEDQIEETLKLLKELGRAPTDLGTN